MLQVVNEPESVKTLRECIELQLKKSADYQSKSSDIVQADYYIRGIDSIYDMMHTKMLRIQSLIDAARSGNATGSNFESIEDSAKDLINYSSFAVSWLRKKMEGQNVSRDMFNRKQTFTSNNLPPLTQYFANVAFAQANTIPLWSTQISSSGYTVDPTALDYNVSTTVDPE